MFESPDKLVLGLVTGIAFGFLLQKGQATKYQVILGQLLLKDWRILKIMATAIVVGAAGVYALVYAGAASLDIWPFQLAGVLIGAVLFGIGLAVFGYCPGTGVAASGEGSRDAMVGLAGMLFGAGVFVVAYPLLDPLINAWGDYGKVTVPDAADTRAAGVIITMGLIVAVVFRLIERSRPRTPTKTSRVLSHLR
jgi:uncharacterized membrane protein YedE/YeeE